MLSLTNVTIRCLIPFQDKVCLHMVHCHLNSSAHLAEVQVLCLCTVDHLTSLLGVICVYMKVGCHNSLNPQFDSVLTFKVKYLVVVVVIISTVFK